MLVLLEALPLLCLVLGVYLLVGWGTMYIISCGRLFNSPLKIGEDLLYVALWPICLVVTGGFLLQYYIRRALKRWFK